MTNREEIEERAEKYFQLGKTDRLVFIAIELLLDVRDLLVDFYNRDADVKIDYQ